MTDIISQNLIISNEDILNIQPEYGFTKYNITLIVLLMTCVLFLGFKLCFLEGMPTFLKFLDGDISFIVASGVAKLLLVLSLIDLIYFYFVKYKKKIDIGLYSLELHLIDKNISLNTVAFEFFKGSFLLPFCAFAKSEQSKYFILLQQKTVTYPEWIFLKKDAITHADFQRLQEAIPCLQGLTVDPQQFKQESPTHES